MYTRKWDQWEIEYLLEKGQAGLKTAEWRVIANHIDRSIPSVQQKFRALGMEVDKEHPEEIEGPTKPEPSSTFEGEERFTFVYVSDTHGELIDKGCAKAIGDFIEAHNPDERYHGGDVFDLRPLRNGAGAEDKGHSIISDVEQGLEFLKAYKPHRITWGNHDARLWDMAESLRDSFEIDAARMLKDKIEAHTRDAGSICSPYEKIEGWQEIAPGRLIGHGVASNMYPAKTNCIHFGSTITGHVHAFDYHRLDNLRADESYVSGCMCKINQPYNRTHRRTLKHQHGFLYGVADRSTGDWQLWPVRKDSRGRWMDPTNL